MVRSTSRRRRRRRRVRRPKVIGPDGLPVKRKRRKRRRKRVPARGAILEDDKSDACDEDADEEFNFENSSSETYVSVPMQRKTSS